MPDPPRPIRQPTDEEREAARAKARALAPAYDFIRAWVTRWETEQRERASGREDQAG